MSDQQVLTCCQVSSPTYAPALQHQGRRLLSLLVGVIHTHTNTSHICHSSPDLELMAQILCTVYSPGYEEVPDPKGVSSLGIVSVGRIRSGSLLQISKCQPSLLLMNWLVLVCITFKSLLVASAAQFPSHICEWGWAGSLLSWLSRFAGVLPPCELTANSFCRGCPNHHYRLGWKGPHAHA